MIKILFVLSMLSLLSRLGVAAAAYPFPQNDPQPFAANYPTYNNADVTAVYNSWKAAQVTTNGAGGFRRVQRNGDVTLQANSTVSEGIAYGMIIAVYMNDQALFDDLWRYHNLHLDGNGLMHWYISADGNTVLGSGAASDADQDIAWALAMAHYQWGSSGVLAQPYLTYALDIINKMWTHEVEKPSMVFRNGDGWGGAGTLNVSYMDPAAYRLFAQLSGNAGWLQVVETSYQALFASLNATNGNQNNGLVPAWSNLAGQPVVAFAGAPTHFQYDSCRTPFRFAKDWYFYGEPRALSYTAKLNAFYGAIGASNITDGYDLNGAERPQYDTLGNGDTGQSAAFVGPALVGAMTQAGMGAFSQEAYDNLKTDTLLIGGPYYDQSWTVLSLLMASGNFLNYAPQPTPTPTPDACQFRVNVNVGGTGQGGFQTDKAHSAGSWGYLAGYAGAVGTSGGPVTGGSEPGLYLTERYGADLRYRFTAPNGPATVTLHWAETYHNSAGQRSIDVSINGVQRENNLDLYAAAGGQNKALIRSYALTVAGGQIDLILTEGTGQGTLHAIEVVSGALCSPTRSPTPTPNWTATTSPTRTPSYTRSPSFSASPTPSASPSISPTFTPVSTPDACSVIRRLNAGGGAFSGSGGLNWSADKAYTAGTYGYVSFAAGTGTTSGGPIGGTNDDALYMAERYGNPVRYRFDVPNGDYRVRVLLAETYFATAGQRNVSLSANGAVILNNADLFTRAGGLNQAWELTFTATAAGGQLYLEAWSSNNNGTFQAIELISVLGCSPTTTPSRTAVLQSPTFSATATVTRTGSPTASASATPSRTRTSSPSASATSSSSATPSLSSTPSLSATGSATPTLSATPSQSGSPTRSPTVTLSPSITLSATASGTQSPGPSPTSSATPSRTPSFSPSASISPSLTPSASPTPSVTGSATVTLTAVLSATFSPTLTASPPGTLTHSPTLTATSTSSASPTLSVTAADSATLSSTPSRTATPTATVSPQDTASATASPTLSATPTAGAMVATPLPRAGGSGQPLLILAAFPVPNPNPLGLSVQVQGGPGTLEWRLYTAAMTCVAQDQVRVKAGWNQLPATAALAGLGNGTYYLELGLPGLKVGRRLLKLSVLK